MWIPDACIPAEVDCEIVDYRVDELEIFGVYMD